MIKKTIFNTIEIPNALEGPDYLIDDIIQIGIVISNFFDLFGTSMRIVKNDVDGNIKKLTMSKDIMSKGQSQVTIQQMLTYEKKLGSNKKDPSGTIGLLWLKRTFDFTITLLSFLTNHICCNSQATMALYLKNAYDKTLKVHHNILMKTTFNTIISVAAPYRSDFLRKVALDDSLSENEILADIKTCLIDLAPVLSNIHKILVSFHEEKDFESDIYLIS